MGYKCYDGQLLLPFDQDWKIYERDTVSQTDPFFISREDQINSFIRAGERLQMARRELFEYPDGEVPFEVEVDPTSVVGFDLADASALQNRLKEKSESHKLEVDADVSPEDEPSETESVT